METTLLPYPLDIVPRPSFKKKLIIDKLLAVYADLMVVRLVHGNVSDHILKTDQGEDELAESVFENSMASLSLNLAGGKFDTHPDAHLRFLAKSEYGTSEWNGKRVILDEFSASESYSDNYPCFGLCFRVHDLHKRVFPFHKGFAKQEERDEYAKRVALATDDWKGNPDARLVGAFESKRQPVVVRGRLEVHHAPTNGNYWHTTLDTYRPTDKTFVRPTGDRQSVDRNMFKALKQDLLQCCEVDSVPQYRISRRQYMKWYACLVPCVNF